MINKPITARTTLPLLLTCVLATCSSAYAHDKSIKLSLTSAKPDVTHVDTGATGSSVGDYQVFSAPITKDGKPFGTLFGLKLQVTPPGSSLVPAGMGIFQNQLTFSLPDGVISVTGLQQYSMDGTIPAVSLKGGETRAVVGGTGAYAGARGTVHTTANEDGTRSQVLTFVVP